MAQDFTEGLEQKKVRGWVLRILDRSYPAGLEKDTLKTQLNGIGYDVTNNDVSRAVAYLESKECVDVDRKTYTGMVRETITISSKGIDITQGAIDEPIGIDV